MSLQPPSTYDRNSAAGQAAMAQRPGYTGDPDGYQRDQSVEPPGMWGETPSPVDGAESLQPGGEPLNSSPGALKHEPWLLQKARELYTTSTDYMTANVTKTWERSLAHFRNEHAPGSYYRQVNWRRSRTFRPKTRSNIKASEAAFFAAAFSTQDFAVIAPQDQTNPKAAVSAAVTKALVQYRCEHTLKWTLTSLGCFQDTKVYGVCITHQAWDYAEDVRLEPALNEDGSQIFDEDGVTPMGEEKRYVQRDRPAIAHVEPENFRFDPMCDWRDPANTSPYLVWTPPMHVSDVLELMSKADPKTGQPVWRPLSRAQILSARVEEDNRTRQAREGQQRLDPIHQEKGTDQTIVWPHMNILRVKGTDIVWWTLGTEFLLTEPMLLTEMYPHLMPGERPFVVGFSNIEAHRNFPSSDAEQGATLQIEINDIANQRMDNVKLALNKRYFVRRGSQIDLDALIRNVPGGGVMVNDPEKDVNIVSTPDVTSSSYQEQTLLSTDYDELVGGFSQGSVANNRKLNETVGGMDNLRAAAGSVSDYSINIFFQTWMLPVLRQLVRMEQRYETDQVVLAIAAQKSSMFERFGQSTVTDELMLQDLTVDINVGVGNTDPTKRVQKLLLGVKVVAALPTMAARIKASAIADEVFGSLGYRSADRFFMTDTEYAQAQKHAPPPPVPMEIQVKLKELALRQQDQNARHQKEAIELAQNHEIEMAQIAAKYKISADQLYTMLGIESAKNQTRRDEVALKESNRLQETFNQHAMDVHQANQPPALPAPETVQ